MNGVGIVPAFLIQLRPAMSLSQPKVGFVSLGCPKATVDSERILSRLRSEGYDIVGSYDGADLVVSSITLSYDVDPFLDARWLKPGAFAAITDLALPWIPASMGAFESVVIDDREQEESSPRPMVDPALVSGDLTDLVTGRLAGGFAPARRSAFVFRGIAVGDFALAALAYERAIAAGKGTRVS